MGRQIDKYINRYLKNGWIRVYIYKGIKRQINRQVVKRFMDQQKDICIIERQINIVEQLDGQIYIYSIDYREIDN